MMFLRDLARRAPEWDASVKASLALALLLFLLLMSLGLAGPPAFRLPARIGAFGVLVTGQLLFLWGNRREISPYHQAQQRFVAGEYESARSILESLPSSTRPSVDALVLLGNCYQPPRAVRPEPRRLGAGAGAQSPASPGPLQLGKAPPRLGRMARPHAH